MKYLIYILIPFVFISCIPEDTPVAPYDRGDVVIAEVGMGSLYEKQLYFSFAEDTIVAENDITAWDLGFACDYHHHIIINFATSAKIYNLGKVDFESVTQEDVDAIGDSLFSYDNQFGKIDSTAIGEWWNNESNQIISKNDVYILNRGNNAKAKKLGIYKLQIRGFDGNKYKIRYANIKDNLIIEAEVEKNPNYNYVYYSITTEETLMLEPTKNSWDILFSKNMDLLYTNEGDALWYSVSSVLINGNGVEAALIISDDYESIDISVTDTLAFSTYKNAIGHEWKWYDLEGGSYTVQNNRIYIIKDVRGFYYKLRFIDFYNDSGEKGYPKFEYKLL